MKKLGIKDSIQYMKKAYKYMEENKKLFIAYIFLSIIVGIIGAIIPLISAQVILKIQNELWLQLIVVAICFVSMRMLSSFVSYLASKVSRVFYRETYLNIQVEVARSMIDLETKEIDANSSGVFIDRLSQDASDIAEIFRTIFKKINVIITNVGILFAVYTINKIVFIFFIIVLTIIFYFEKMYLVRQYERTKYFKKVKEANTGLVSELVRGIRDIKVLNCYSAFESKIYKKLKQANIIQYQMSEMTKRYELLREFLKNAANLLFIILCIYLIKNDMLLVANFVILFMYSDKVFDFLVTIIELLEVLKSFNLSAERVFEIIDGKYQKEQFGALKVKKLDGTFKFENVNFGYIEGINVLKKLNLEIPAFQTTAIVGESGAGKTTIFNIITKLYRINSGKITIDGYNIEDLTEESLRGNISFITQNPYIFNFSVKENFQIVKKNATMKEIEDVCKKACIHDFIMSLPKKYETELGEGGVNLSGGQRQRIAIARALLTDAKIILFDEATSALDNETQQNITQAINNLQGEYTIIIIAHRLSTIKESNQIVVMQNGKVVGKDTHKNLLKNNEYYQRLYANDMKR